MTDAAPAPTATVKALRPGKSSSEFWAFCIVCAMTGLNGAATMGGRPAPVPWERIDWVAGLAGLHGLQRGVLKFTAIKGAKQS